LGAIPQFGRGVELGGRVLYHVKLFHISYNLFAGTEMLSLRYTSQSQYKFCMGVVPQFGGKERSSGGRVWYPETYARARRQDGSVRFCHPRKHCVLFDINRVVSDGSICVCVRSVLSRLDYCKAVLVGLPATPLGPFQGPFYAATRLVLERRLRDQLTTGLLE